MKRFITVSMLIIFIYLILKLSGCCMITYVPWKLEPVIIGPICKEKSEEYPFERDPKISLLLRHLYKVESKKEIKP